MTFGNSGAQIDTYSSHKPNLQATQSTCMSIDDEDLTD